MAGAMEQDLWNGTRGQRWVEAQKLTDRMFKPVEDLLAEEVAAEVPAMLLDVGCGAGSTTLRASEVMGGKGTCVGLDISEALVEAARARAKAAGAPVDFIRADAETHDFAGGKFDLVMSRFGVMFFDDFVEGYTNLRRAAAPDGALCVITWREPQENPFMTAAGRAVKSLLPDLPSYDPDAPGQFGMADEGKIRRVIEGSGWKDLAYEPVDFECAFPVSDIDMMLTHLGPLGTLMQTLDLALAEKVYKTAKDAFTPYIDGDEVKYTAGCWKITARNG